MTPGAGLLAALAAAAAQAGSGTEAAPAYPLEQVLDSARAMCAAVPTAADVDGGAPAGWEVFTPDPATPFGRHFRSQTTGFGRGFRVTARPLRATGAGRPLYALVATVSYQGSAGTSSCEVFDFDSTVPLDRDRITRWSGREPSRVRDLVRDLAGLTGETPSPENDARSPYVATWSPGLAPRHSSSEVGLVAGRLSYLAFTGGEAE